MTGIDAGITLAAFGPDGNVWFKPIRAAVTFRERFRGFMFSSPKPMGLWFSGCRFIHSHWMRFPLDILFLGEDGFVLRHTVLMPWSFASHPQAASILEIPLGIADTKTLPDRLSLAPLIQ
jgi:uncharacterized membrane protein (UPF0127 family)